MWSLIDGEDEQLLYPQMWSLIDGDDEHLLSP